MSTTTLRRVTTAALLLSLLACGSGTSSGDSEPSSGDSEPSSGDTVPDDEAPAVVELSCPTGTLTLTTGRYKLTRSCSVDGDLVLSGDVMLSIESADLTIDGDLVLEQDAEMTMREGVLTLSNHELFEHAIIASGRAVLDLQDIELSTNAGALGNLTSNYNASDDAVMRATRVFLDSSRSWLLGNLWGRARVELIDSQDVPTEIYPSESSTVRIEGRESSHGLWLAFLEGDKGVLGAMPTTRPFTFHFGRETPGTVGVDYQVDIVGGWAGIGVSSYPGSDVTVGASSDATPLSYMLQNVTETQTLSDLAGGRQSVTLNHQGRTLTLDDAVVIPFGWQIYNDNAGLAVEDVAPVVITNSLINELGGAMHARFEVADSVFGFAVIAAVGPGARTSIERSVINSQAILADYDATIQISDSAVLGSLIQANGSSRVVLINTKLGRNECTAACQPMCVSLDGSAPTRCNGFNPAIDVQLNATGEAAIIALGLDEIPRPIAAGARHEFTGDAFVESAVPGLDATTYDLIYFAAGTTSARPIVVGASGQKHGERLGELDTTGLAPGAYVAVLNLHIGGSTLQAGRQFTIGAAQ